MNHEGLMSDENLLIWHKLSLGLESKNLSVIVLNHLLMVWKNPHGFMEILCVYVRVCARTLLFWLRSLK